MSAQTTNQENSSPVMVWVMVILGLGMAYGGMVLSKQEIAFQTMVEGMGIPINFGKAVATIGVFMVLYKVIEGFFFKPLNEAISERTTNLENTFTEAENLREEMRSMRSDYEKRIVETEAHAREQIQSQIKEAQDLRSQIMAEANARADDMVKKAQQDIEVQRSKIITEVRTHVADLAIQATEKIIGDNLDDARNRKLVQDFIEKAEVPSS